MNQVKLKVGRGPVVVNNGFVYKRGEDIVAIDIDMNTKHPVLAGTGYGPDSVPSIYLAVDENSLHYNVSEKSNLTEIEFPEFEGWTVFSEAVSKYTLRVCLVRDGAT